MKLTPNNSTALALLISAGLCELSRHSVIDLAGVVDDMMKVVNVIAGFFTIFAFVVLTWEGLHQASEAERLQRELEDCQQHEAPALPGQEQPVEAEPKEDKERKISDTDPGKPVNVYELDVLLNRSQK
jgi:hypothetical protein